jgi:lysophospholipase L1-like esterase
MTSNRRGFLAVAAAALGGGEASPAAPLALYTFGDSILDCGGYNAHGVHPGALLVRNDDRLFPEFKGQDLHAHGGGRLEHRAVDGATVDSLPRQSAGLSRPQDRAVALLTVGGNDLLRGLAADTGPGVKEFERKLLAWVRGLPIRPLLVGTVYDPTLGDDSRNFLGVPAKIARANLKRVNTILAETGARHGAVADLQAHFLRGDASWFVHTIEPSLRGASEVRRAFWPLVRARA